MVIVLTDRWFLHRMRSVRRRAGLKYAILRAETRMDWFVGGDGPVLLCTTSRKEPKLMEYKCLP